MAEEEVEYCSQEELEDHFRSNINTLSEMLGYIKSLNVPFRKHKSLDVLLDLKAPHEILRGADGDGVVVVKSKGNMVSADFHLDEPVTVYAIYQRGFDFGYFIAYSEKE